MPPSAVNGTSVLLDQRMRGHMVRQPSRPSIPQQPQDHPHRPPRNHPHSVIVPYPVYGGYGYPYSPYGSPFFVSPFYSSLPFDGVYPTAGYGYYPGTSGDTDELQQQVEGLNAQVQQLQQQDEVLRKQLQEQTATPETQTQEEATPQSQTTVVQEARPVTVLIFKDGRRSEIQNYAIVGDTLWVLTDQRATKIALADLDLDQTIKINQEHGVYFPVDPPAPAADQQP